MFDLQRFAEGEGENSVTDNATNESSEKTSDENTADNLEKNLTDEIQAKIENGRKELQRKELMLEMTKVLAERNLPVEFMEYLIGDDDESTLERIKTFEKKYKAAIEAAVNEKLKGKTPTAGAGNKNFIAANNAPRPKDGIMKIISDNQVKRG